MLTVAIIDDVPDLRGLLRHQFDGAPDFEVCAEGGDGAVAVAIAADLHPDVLLLDLSMPVINGMTALPLILAASPGTRVVVLSGTMDRARADRATTLGAAGCLSKVLRQGPLPDRLRGVLTKTNREAAIGDLASEPRDLRPLCRDVARPTL